MKLGERGFDFVGCHVELIRRLRHIYFSLSQYNELDFDFGARLEIGL